jgi:hypothetical protein
MATIKHHYRPNPKAFEHFDSFHAVINVLSSGLSLSELKCTAKSTPMEPHVGIDWTKHGQKLIFAW